MLGLLFINITNTTSFAQSAPKFGKIDEEEVKMTQYAKDPEASAVVLMDYGRATFKYSESSNFQIVFTGYKRIKILKKDAYDLANIKIPSYYINGNERERINDIKGFTYNMQNGVLEKSKLEKDAIFEEKKDGNWNYKKFAMPNVKEGSVIEYQYELVSDFLFNMPTWYFQGVHPVMHSEYVTEIPEYFNYVKNSQTYDPFTEHKTDEKNGSITFATKTRSEGNVTQTSVDYDKLEYRIKVDRWVMKDIPAFKNERFITSYGDCINKIEFQLASIQYPQQPLKSVMDSWEILVEKLLNNESYGGYLDKHSPIKDIVAAQIAGKTTAKEKMDAIYNYVKNNIRYNDDDGIYTDHKMKDVIEKKTGSSAEINLLLIAMLREAGLEAHPILLSTRMHGKINTAYPILNKFNYSIAYVNFDNEEHLLDATDPMRPVDMLPEYALSEQGLLIIKKDQFGWANLLNRYKSSKMVYAKLELGADGKIKGQMDFTLNGYEAIDARRDLGKKEEKTSENEGETQSEESEYSKMKVSFENLNDYEKPLKGKANYENTEFADVAGDKIYLNPMLGFKMKENPLKLEDRKFPVDFAYPFEETYYLNFTIPEGYVVEEMPQPVRTMFEDKTIKFDYLVNNQIANMVQIVCKFSTTRAIFQAEEYKHLKDFFAKVVSKQNEQIVLKKK
jgi:hypothetical protein